MKQLYSITVLMTSLFVGSVIKNLLGLPIPETVYAMVILFLLLYTRVVKYDAIEKFAGVLLGTMAMYFIPPAVGLVNSYPLIADKIIPFIIISVVSTILTFMATGLTVKYLVVRKDVE